MRGGVLRARGGRIQLASVASPGEVVFSPLELAPDLQLDAFARLGRMALSQEATVTVSNLIEGSDAGAGTVLLRGGRLLVDNASIQANTATGESARLGIDLRLAEEVVLTHGALLRAGSTGAGRAGDVQLIAGGLHMDNSLSASPPSGAGHGGNITVHVDRFTLTNGAQISSGSFGAGRGGHLTIAAGEAISIAGRNSAGFKSGLFSTAEGSGDAGRMAIFASTLTMDEGLITTVTEGVGRGGDLEVKVGRLTLTGGAFIDSSTNGPGLGGTVALTATDAVTISGRDSASVPSRLLSFARDRGGYGPGDHLRACPEHAGWGNYTDWHH
jgi:hypothetical protein